MRDVIRAKLKIMVKVRSGRGHDRGGYGQSETRSAGVSVSDLVGSSRRWGAGVGLVTLGQAGPNWEPLWDPV